MKIQALCPISGSHGSRKNMKCASFPNLALSTPMALLIFICLALSDFACQTCFIYFLCPFFVFTVVFCIFVINVFCNVTYMTLFWLNPCILVSRSRSLLSLSDGCKSIQVWLVPRRLCEHAWIGKRARLGTSQHPGWFMFVTWALLYSLGMWFLFTSHVYIHWSCDFPDPAPTTNFPTKGLRSKRQSYPCIFQVFCIPINPQLS